MFLIGKQDIEDSIPIKVWKSIINEKFGDLIDIRDDEISYIIDNIPNDREIPAEQKFQPKLKSLVSSKLQAIEKNNEINRLQNKGNEWGKLIAKHLKSKEQIPSTLCKAFDVIRTAKK